MRIDISQVAFSRAGSFICLNVLPKLWNVPGVTLRSMRGGGRQRETFRLEPIRAGSVVAWECDATPGLLTIRAEGGGTIECCLPESDVLRIRVRGIGLRMTSHEGKPTVFRHAGGAWQVNSFESRTQYLLRTVSGRLAVDEVHHVPTQDASKPEEQVKRPWCVIELTPDAGDAELELHDFASTPRRHAVQPGFDAALAKGEAAWSAFVARTPAVAAEWDDAARVAMYVNYSSIIPPDGGTLKRPTMLMSKNWMNECWSWDHCINALAHAGTDPDLAWDQFQVPFDHQDAFGCLPDSVSGGGTQRNFTKPPIHGWTLSRMRALNPALLTPERAKTAEEQLAAWTRWWLDHRDTDGDGLPEYRHGNDSGWDNGTVFDVGYPMTAPDLPTYLVLQLDELAALAQLRGASAVAADWRRQADTLLQTMIDALWTGTQFQARQGFTGARPTRGDCLLNHIPILLGQRLPARYRDPIAARLAPDGPFVTPFGPATESPASELFVADGYWRGPIWGPETVMIADGLLRGGYREAAIEVTRRYCAMCRASRCFAENYDALSGAPLRDKGYTWGSSAYLYLLQAVGTATQGAARG